MNPELYQELVRQINNLQKQVDGLVKPEVGRWIDWTPTVTQSGAVTVDLTGISFARYIVTDSTVIIRARFTVTSAGVAGNMVTIGGLPIAIANASGDIGVARINDIGTASYVGVANITGADTFAIISDNTTSFVGSTPSFALANGDIISFLLTYEQD